MIMENKKYKNSIKIVLIFLIVGLLFIGLIQAGLVKFNQVAAQEEEGGGEEGGGEEGGGVQFEINQAAIDVGKKYTEFVINKYPDILSEAYSGSAQKDAKDEADKWKTKLDDARNKLNQCQGTQP